MTVTVIGVFKLTLSDSKICTKWLLFLFSDDRLKVKQCQITSKTKMMNILKFKQNTTAYWFVYSLKKCLIVGNF